MKRLSITSMAQFREITAGKSISCYGAGRGFRNLCTWFNETGMPEIQVRCISDSNSKIWGKVIVGPGGISIPVIPPDRLRREIRVDSIIIITAAGTIADDIRSMLDGWQELSDTTCLEYTNIRNAWVADQMRSVRLPDNLRITDKPLIPKVIHYCWFGGAPVPEEYRRYIDSWRKFCPDYEIVRWDESNYDYKKNKYMYDAYKAKKWGFVPDYARLDIIYTHGGIYLDTDVEVIKPLDDFLYQEGFGGWQPDGRFAMGLGFGAVKGHQFLKELLLSYDGYEFVDFLTKKERTEKKIKASPTLQTEFLKSKGCYWDNTVTDVDGFRIYPAPVLCPIFAADANPVITDKTYTIHHFAGTWMPKV